MTELIVFDDAVARTWAPFALTRPIGELLFGALVQRARLERVVGAPCAGYLGCPELAGFEEPGAPPVLTGEPAADRARVYLCSRVVPDWGASVRWPAERAAVLIDGRVAGWYVPGGASAPAPAVLADPTSAAVPGPPLELPGRWLEHVWNLVTENAEQVVADFGALSDPAVNPTPPSDAIGFRPGMLHLGAQVVLEPGVVLDFSEGPIWLDDRVTVRAFTRLAGPAFVGPDTVLLGGPYSHVSVGPGCKVHGELEASVILGYSNKAHDGFLGHAYLGRWVNLGAMTTNSDLKNNYGTVRLWTPAGTVDTGEMKLGCLLGDHVKTGIGALLNTGTVVGAGANLFGTAMPPKYVPPFSWGSGEDLERYDIEKFLVTAELAMARRRQHLSEAMKRLLREAWQRDPGVPA
ncbi:MAG TPA: putative sugar nucleotidyl transferase [Longimicrobiales bacterium]|nr:putative sugar nucleotidyl transferase [Longimicrobiales bacterium]